MALVSVDIAALAQLVAALKAAPEKITGAHSSIKGQLAAADLDTSSLSAVPEVATWAEDEAAHFDNRLYYARWLESSAPGLQEVVTFDDAAVPDLTYEEAKKHADRAQELMTDEDVPPPQELIDLLEKYGADPIFARLLMNGWKEGDGYASADMPPRPDLGYIHALTGDSDLREDSEFNAQSERFLQLYSNILGGLSHEWDLEVDFSEHYPSNEPVPDAPRAWALLASRGSWSSEWLTELTQQMIDLEREDPDVWTKDQYEYRHMSYRDVEAVWDPSMGAFVEDPMVWMMDALSRDPDAAASLFNGGKPGPIKVDGEEVDIAGNLRFLTLERGWPQDQGLSLAIALGSAKGSDSAGDLTTDLANLENMDPVEKKSWYSFAAHIGLDILGLIPGIGEWADGANVSLYLAEGDWKSATASGMAAIPVFGSTATIGKWIKLANRTGDAASAALTADTLKGLLEELDLVDQDPSKAAPPEIGDDAVYLTSTGDKPWHEKLGSLKPNQTYVLDGGYLIRTDEHGSIAETVGDAAVLDEAESDWIDQHRK